MLLDWFDTKDLVIFGERFADDLTALVPAATSHSVSIGSQKIKRRLNSLLHKTDVYLAGNSFNFYKKAKFLNIVKWRLRDAGHGEDFIDEVVSYLVTRLNK